MNAPPVSPRSIELQSSEYNAVCGWPFTDSYVARLLRQDIPQRVAWGSAAIWVYCDSSNEIVGFGSLDVCKEYGYLTADMSHTYIPLLAVHPDKQRNGYGTAIVNHLVDEAAVTATLLVGHIANTLFLDVYTCNVRAINLYQRSDFKVIGEEYDEREKQQYLVMARSIAISP